MSNRILEIRQKKVVLEMSEIEKSQSSGFHESLFRSYSILEYVKDYLLKNEKIDSEILLEIINAMEN